MPDTADLRQASESEIPKIFAETKGNRKRSEFFAGSHWNMTEDREIIDAVEAIYEAALLPERLPNALQAIADCFEDVGASLLWGKEDGSVGSVVSPRVQREQELYEQGGWNARDLRVLRAASRGYFFNGAAFTDRHVCSEEEIRTDPIYVQFLASTGIAWFCGVAVSPDPHMGVLLCVHRCQGRQPYSDAELSLISRLGRHLEKSLRLSVRLFDVEVTKVGLGNALARVGIGVFALDSLGRVVYLNPAGESMLGGGLILADGRLLTVAASAGTLLADAVTQATSDLSVDIAADLKPILIDRQEAKRPLAIYVLPIPLPSRPIAQFLSRARVIILALSPEADAPADPALVRDLLGLTLGEARVAALVGSGLTLRNASEKLGITEQTARSTLKQVFSKTGVSRQGELALLLNRLALRR